jgi:hypothetical protein
MRQQVKLYKIKGNPLNPRIIKNDKFKKLVKSIQEFPEMLKQKKEFIVKDNVAFGEWDWDSLGNEWDNVKLGEWGMDVWQPEEAVDYSILDDLDLGSTLEDKEAGVKRAIQIEFEPEHYDEAVLLINTARKEGKNVGLTVLNAFRNER